MSSEQLADGVNPLDAELAATWDVLKGYSGRDTDLGIARRFGGSAAAYSLRDIGAMNGSVVRVRREPEDTTDGIDDEEKFSANQVQDGTLERWVNGKLESTLPCDVGTDFASGSFVVSNAASSALNGTYIFNSTNSRWEKESLAGRYFFLDGSDWKFKISTIETETANPSGIYPWTSDFTSNQFVGESVQYSSIDFSTAAAAYSLRKVKDGYSGDAVRIRRSSDDIEVDVAFDSDGKVSASSAITNVAEQGGESGSTTATTLGDFISGTDAFVHTWYDQAGSNNATQATDANQPKIAENGALLADGIDFDGVNDFLESTTLSSIYTGTDEAHSSFVVVNSDVASTTQYILGIGSTSSSNPLRNTLFHSGGNIGWQVRDDAGTLKTDLSANPYIANQTYLVSALNSGTTIDFNTNSVINDNGTDADVGASTINTVKIGALAVNSSSPLNGSIKEAIFYASDQSANRFKIESNINNYYGLYNDANDFASDETAFRFLNERSGGTSASSDLSQYTLDVQTASAYAGAKFSSNVLSGDSIYVSFNASLDEGSFTASPKVGLRNIDSFLNGTLYSNEGEVTEGFNSFQLTSTNNAASGIVWSEGDDNVIFTISNIKVSRIARNGFVETWYDQSGNGFDLKSQSADTQPFIVNNGGFTGGVYSPSRLNNSTKQYLEISDPDFDSTNITSSKFGWLAVMANMEENDGSQAGGVILGNTRNTQSYPAGSIALNLSDTNPNGRMFVTNLKTSSTGDFIGAVDNDDLFLSETIGTAVVDGSSLSTFLNGTTGSGTFTDLTLTSDVHFKIFQASDSVNNVYYQNAAQGFIKELMFMQGDMIDDIVTIRNEVNNHYNIF